MAHLFGFKDNKYDELNKKIVNQSMKNSQVTYYDTFDKDIYRIYGVYRLKTSCPK